MTDLKPCPFCGALPEKYPRYWDIRHDVACFLSRYVIIRLGEEEKQWNTRADHISDADRERFAAQEERHRVKITEQAKTNRGLVAIVQRGIDGSECACREEQCFGVDKCWHCEAVEALAKHRRAGE